ncbi:hypothetical protein ACFOLJ_01880 [Rugamonas sp. CCM 8940]|uniref:hypothetical protein n=1 Tax=Rugamonas sp. CCM 8940 TaxID=2765359 RepID=UPI0018F60E00|nr:hypothetical protein [Rugamonas sp. CCM 8940]MBJ7311692.1 hypothetical protein [Rugamonas sp. CCM 8940]
MDKDLDALLSTPLLDVPDNFTQGVMRRVQFLPLPQRHSGWLEKLQGLVLVVGGILGATQLAAFLFGMWSASAAG